MAVSIGVFILVAFIAPDGGPTSINVWQGLVLMAVFAAPAIGALLVPGQAVALGGAMFVAGTATLPGGNVFCVIMLVPGLLLMLAGAAQAPPLTPALVTRLILTTLALLVGVYLALDTGVVTGLIALLLAVIVAYAGRWQTRRD